MEAYSVEDHGEWVSFHVFVYNVQPGIWIDYATGESRESETAESEKKDEEVTYVVNTNTKKFHKPDCSSIRDTKQQNRKETSETREELIDQGYSPCNRCNP